MPRRIIDSEEEEDLDLESLIDGTNSNPLLGQQEDVLNEEDSAAHLAEMAQGKQVDRRQRKTDRKQTPANWQPIAGAHGLTRKQAQTRLTELSSLECSGAMWYGAESEAGGKRRHVNVGGIQVHIETVKVLMCGFCKESGCQARVRTIQTLETGLIRIERAEAFPHSDHNLSYSKAGLPKLVKLKMGSPSKLALPPSERGAAARRLMGADFGKNEQKQLAGLVKRLKKEKEELLVPAGQQGTFGGVRQFIEMHTKDALQAKGTFGIHTVYVCGEAIVDAANQEICIAYSCENLLLNAYRQCLFGVPSICQVDTTHRLVLEGHNNMLFGCVDVAQHFHIIGYGLCAKEDTTSHEYVASCLKAEIEILVEQRRKGQLPV